MIDPSSRSASAYRSLTDLRALHDQDELDGEEVVPGFRSRLGDILT